MGDFIDEEALHNELQPLTTYNRHNLQLIK